MDLYLDPMYHANTSYLLFVNYYVSIISVVFATRESRSLPSSGSDSLRDMSQSGARASPTGSAQNETGRASTATSSLSFAPRLR